MIDIDGKGFGVATTAHQPLVVEGQFGCSSDEKPFDGQTFPVPSDQPRPIGAGLGIRDLRVRRRDRPCEAHIIWRRIATHLVFRWPQAGLATRRSYSASSSDIHLPRSPANRFALSRASSVFSGRQTDQF